jgi:hypothetical protein
LRQESRDEERLAGKQNGNKIPAASASRVLFQRLRVRAECPMSVGTTALAITAVSSTVYCA